MIKINNFTLLINVIGTLCQHIYDCYLKVQIYKNFISNIIVYNYLLNINNL